MDKNSEKKGINLMPENLRSKESSILSKVKNKNDFDFDLVSPENIVKDKEFKSFSFLSKIKKIFNKPKKFGEAIKKVKKVKDNGRPKIVYNPNKKKIDKLEENKDIKNNLHIPDKQDKKIKDNFKVDYKDSVLGDIKKEKKGLSFWQKLFATKPKTSKVSKIEKVAAKPILAQEIKEPKKEEILPVLDKDKIKAVPEILTKKESIIKPKKVKSKGPSFWDKFKKLFASKIKKHEAPYIERVPAKPILVKEELAKEEKNIALEKLDKDKIKVVPKLLIPKEEKPKLPTKEELKIIDEKVKTSDFSIPNIPELSEIKKAPVKSEDKPKIEEPKSKLLSKFHKPQPRIRAKFLGEGGGVDLIPDAVKTRSWRQVLLLLLIAGLASLFIVFIFYGFLFYQVKNVESQKDLRSEQITALEKTILGYQELNNTIKQLGDEIVSVHRLLNFHFYWTNFFQLLEKYTVAEIYYSGLTAGNGGAITLQVIGTDFDSVARQIKVLEQEEAKEFVSLVSVESITYTEGSEGKNGVEGHVEFEMTIVLNPSLFIYNENYIYEISTSTDEGDEEE